MDVTLIDILSESANEREFSLPLLDALHASLDRCDIFLSTVSKEDVLNIMRRHLELVLCEINRVGLLGHWSDNIPPSSNIKEVNKEPHSFEYLNRVSGKKREEAFISIYIYGVLPQLKVKEEKK